MAQNDNSIFANGASFFSIRRKPAGTKTSEVVTTTSMAATAASLDMATRNLPVTDISKLTAVQIDTTLEELANDLQRLSKLRKDPIKTIFSDAAGHLRKTPRTVENFRLILQLMSGTTSPSVNNYRELIRKYLERFEQLLRVAPVEKLDPKPTTEEVYVFVPSNNLVSLLHQFDGEMGSPDQKTKISNDIERELDNVIARIMNTAKSGLQVFKDEEAAETFATAHTNLLRLGVRVDPKQVVMVGTGKQLALTCGPHDVPPTITSVTYNNGATVVTMKREDVGGQLSSTTPAAAVDTGPKTFAM